VSKNEFNEIDNNNGFIESACVFDNYYGSAKQTLKDLLAQNPWRFFKPSLSSARGKV
jgi:guanylate kinase